MKILIADRLALFRESLRLLLERLGAPVTFVEAGDCDDAWQVIATQPDLDLAILDDQLPNGLAGHRIDDIILNAATTPIVLMTSDTVNIRRALRLGVLGVIQKNQSGTSILAALRKVLSGGLYLPQHGSRI